MIPEIEYGFCHCGCGCKTNIAKITNKKRGWKKGEPVKFIHNHHCKGSLNSGWKGGLRDAHDGKYREVLINGDYEYLHRVIAEKALGKPLPKGVEIHHWAGHENGSDSKIVICENREYHALIEARARAFYACGHANWRLCKHCHKYDDPENLYINHKSRSAIHRKCNADAQAKVRERRRIRMAEVDECFR